MRPTDIVPQLLINELLRLGKINTNWLELIELSDKRYTSRVAVPTMLEKLWVNASDAYSMHALSRWLCDGPKLFRPTSEQCSALENIEVRLSLKDYSQPYPALLVELPRGRYDPFTSVLCFRHDRPYLICTLTSKDHLNDITTTIAMNYEAPIEESLVRFDDDCKELGPVAALALRVACNSCLALSHYGSHLDYLFPKEVETDRRLSREHSERGQRAKSRLRLTVQVATFDREVVLHRVKQTKWKGVPGCSGLEMPPHWRRGHWAMQPCGVGGVQRKRILRPPVMVRSDLFVGETSNTQATYSASS